MVDVSTGAEIRTESSHGRIPKKVIIASILLYLFLSLQKNDSTESFSSLVESMFQEDQTILLDRLLDEIDTVALSPNLLMTLNQEQIEHAIIHTRKSLESAKAERQHSGVPFLKESENRRIVGNLLAVLILEDIRANFTANRFSFFDRSFPLSIPVPGSVSLRGAMNFSQENKPRITDLTFGSKQLSSQGHFDITESVAEYIRSLVEVGGKYRYLVSSLKPEVVLFSPQNAYQDGIILVNSQYGTLLRISVRGLGEAMRITFGDVATVAGRRGNFEYRIGSLEG